MDSLFSFGRVKWQRYFRRVGFMLSTADEHGAYGPVGAKSRSYTLTVWWLR